MKVGDNCTEEIHNLSSPNIITIIKLRRMWWARHEACMVAMKNVYKSLKGRDHLMGIDVDGSNGS
jgi:hypothetical protein